jgi:hypothetical protein
MMIGERPSVRTRAVEGASRRGFLLAAMMRLCRDPAARRGAVDETAETGTVVRRGR